MLNDNNNDEFEKREGKQIIMKHSDKTLHTLKVLMEQLNMMYYWEKIKSHFGVNKPTLEQLNKLMMRCLKLY